MIKAIVSYSLKAPLPGLEYSSQGYSLSMETEISERDPTAIQARLHETFELVKTQVEQELEKQAGKPAVEGTKTAPVTPAAKPVSDKASNAQVKFITDLAGQKGIRLSDLNADVRQRYGVDGIYDLTKKQASAVLDSMNGKQRKAA